METKDIIATLNGLVEISKDGESGFRTCAEGVKSVRIKEFFLTTAERCAQGASELQNEVRRLGGNPEDGGSVSGSMHRGWVNIKSVITGKDEGAILEECERGEDIAKRAYRSALEKDLPGNVRSIVERQYQGVLENHDRVRDMRNAEAR